MNGWGRLSAVKFPVSYLPAYWRNYSTYPSCTYECSQTTRNRGEVSCLCNPCPTSQCASRRKYDYPNESPKQLLCKIYTAFIVIITINNENNKPHRFRSHWPRSWFSCENRVLILSTPNPECKNVFKGTIYRDSCYTQLYLTKQK